MQIKKGDTIELSITDLAFGGAGIARLKDFVIFVNGAMPGDTVRARLTKIKRNFGEASLEAILRPSPQRITPRCKHFSVCGGCSLQFLDYKDQLKLKEKFVVDALERIGGVALRQAQGDKGEIQGDKGEAHGDKGEAHGDKRKIQDGKGSVMLSLSKHDILMPIRESPSPWFYRNKMEFTFAHERSECALNKIILGLHHTGKFDTVFDLEECYLESQFAVRVIAWVRDWANRTRERVFDLRGSSGLLKTLIIREARSTGEFMVNLVTSDETFGSRENFANKITKAFPEITSLYHTAIKVKKGSRTSCTETLLAGKPMLTEIVRVAWPRALSLIFDIRPQAFFQTNSKGTEALLSLLLALGAPHTDDIVYDLYCGTGIFGMFFAKIVKRVYGIELNPAAIESAKMNASKNGLNNIKFLCGDTGKLIKTLPEKPTIIILDPPRAGLTKKAIEEVLALYPRKILYVSCNPTTLARDLKEFCAHGYSLKKIQPIDMFPQTYHVETICLLIKNIV